MGYTNKTSHYDLPQWIAGDKPSWLGDVNTAMLNIDTAIAGADASATAAESSAAAANAQVQAQEAKITKNTTDIQALTEQLADVSGVANAALPKNGGTMTGALTLAGAPTQDLQAATKKYVDDNSGRGALMLTGGTMTGPLTLSGEPTTDLMAATKKYVDAIVFESDYFNLAACIVGSVLLCYVSGTFGEEVAANTQFAHVAGNPLNLAVNTPTGACTGAVIGGSSAQSLSLFVKYDGTKTVIYNNSKILANTTAVLLPVIKR